MLIVLNLIINTAPTPLTAGFHSYCGKTMEVIGDPSDTAILFVQGGAWEGGSRNIGRAYIKLAEQFFLVLINLDAGGPQQFANVSCAITYLKEHNIQRIGIVGKSSGGQVAAMAGLLLDVDAAVVISAPLDLSVGCKNDRAQIAFGASCGSPTLEWYSPITHVTSKWHPTFLIIHGLNDGVVAPKQARLFAAKMEEVGARAILRLYDGGHEGLYVEDVVEFFEKVF